MKKRLRRILFWLLFLLFIVTAPTAVLYSQGYRFDHYRMIFIHSGSITVKSTPSNPSLYVNGTLKPASNLGIINGSLTIGGLRPGNYDLKIAASGYSDWEKRIEVHSGVSSEFWNVVLIPQTPKINQIESHNVGKFYPSPTGKHIAYVENSDSNFALLSTDVGQNSVSPTYSSPGISFTDNQKENIEWNSKEDQLLCPIRRNGSGDYLLASIGNNAPSQFLSDLSKMTNIIEARWSPQEKGVVYFLAKSQNNSVDLFKFDLSANSPNLIVSGITTYDLSKDSIYLIRDNNILYKSDLEGQNIIQLTSRPFGDEKIGENAQFIAYDDDRQVLITTDGALYVHNNGTEEFLQKIGNSVKGAQFSNDGKKLLFWTGNDISVLFLRKWDVQPYREENEIQSVIRLASTVRNVFWYRDYEHIFYSVGNEIKMIELDPRDHRITNDIFQNNLDSFPATYNGGKSIYYFLQETEGESKIFYFNLPERIGFFG